MTACGRGKALLSAAWRVFLCLSPSQRRQAAGPRLATATFARHAELAPWRLASIRVGFSSPSAVFDAMATSSASLLVEGTVSVST